MANGSCMPHARRLVMLLHILRYDVSHLSEDARQTVEDVLRRLVDVPDVQGLMVGRNATEQSVVGAVVVLDGPRSLDQYRSHPIHVNVAQELARQNVHSVKLDLEVTADWASAAAAQGSQR